MASTFFGLDIGKTGLYAANVGMNTSLQNISNQNTKGYSRQVASQQARSALNVYRKFGMVGTGVEVTSIDRVRDIYYDNKYRSNNAKLGEQNSKYTYGIQMEDSFNEIATEGFTTLYQDMFSTLQELNGAPEDIATRTEFLNYSQSLCDYMNHVQDNLISLQKEVNLDVVNSVERMNTYTEQIASLTKQINIVELAGGTANELRDQRDNLLDDLSDIAPVKVTETKQEGGKTEYAVRVGDFTLVHNYENHPLTLVSRENPNNPYDADGLYDIYYYYDETDGSGTIFDPQSMNLKGSLRGLLDVRDGNNEDTSSTEPVDYKGIPYYVNKVVKFKEAIADAFNTVHDNGINLYGNSTSGVKIFEIDSAGNISVNEDLLKDPSLLATTKSPIQNGIANANLVADFLQIQDTDIINNGTASEYLEGIVTEMGVSTQKAKLFMNNFENIVKTADSQRQSVSGVDEDEETMNLQKYRDAYNLCSHVISVMAQCYNKLINETGV